MENTYNGYKNRSTWLACLHLDNTNEEVYKRAKQVAMMYKEMIEYWEDIKKRDSNSYSYPFHQHNSINNKLKNLLNDTSIHLENEYFYKKIDWSELFNHFLD